MVTVKITILGMVQGIGYRPYVARLAEELHMKGNVRNSNGIVTIMAAASKTTLDQFLQRLREEPPFGARIDSIDVQVVKDKIFDTFSIESSRMEQMEAEQEIQAPLIPPDLTTCPDCERELLDPDNRRYRYPFISCTKCGARYSIIKALPYDRERTTMAKFALCPKCEQEYQKKDGIRRHAQTIACADCGPQLKLTIGNQEIQSGAAYKCAVDLIRKGGILAVKDIGGYHLAASPYRSDTIHALRSLKDREKKPFAVMFASMQQIRSYCHVNQLEEELLTSNARPIVLLTKRNDSNHFNDQENLDSSVCGNSPVIGAMLPCNPLQILLLRDCGPLIMTSANRSGEPMMIQDETVKNWFEEYVTQFSLNKKEYLPTLGVLSHDRDILMPLDDSVVRVVADQVQTIRRARGYVPEPIRIPEFEHDPKTAGQEQIAAAGGDLKSAMCFLTGSRAYISQQLGDTADESVFQWYVWTWRHMVALFDFQPKHFSCDLHPNYVTNQWTKECCTRFRRSKQTNQTKQMKSTNQTKPRKQMKDITFQSDLIPIQHHHAHIASVIAENDLHGTTLGVAFDGTGYGVDHTIWGSEFLLCRGSDYQRVGSIQQVELLGGEQGAKDTLLILMGYLNSLYPDKDWNEIGKLFDGYQLEQPRRSVQPEQPNQQEQRLKQQYQIVARAMEHKVNIVTSTSMGRLFDAVSALLQICSYNAYEGEAAIELEYLAEAYRVNAKIKLPYPNGYPFKVHLLSVGNNQSSKVNQSSKGDQNRMINLLDSADLMSQIIKAKLSHVETGCIALGFLYAISDFIVQMVMGLERKQTLDTPDTHFDQIALSGGTFQNRIVLERTIEQLEKQGYRVYWNHKVPCGDGGISLGQAYLTRLLLQDQES